MKLKEVTHLLPALEIDMGGIPVRQAIPANGVNQVDPFLLLHYGSFEPIQDRPALQQGIGPHPHRGFSPVTFVLQGAVHHRDSLQNSEIAKAGDVQWINAGAGIIHSERPSEEQLKDGDVQEIIQLWINSPSAQKMAPADYQFLPESEMPVFHSADQKVRNKLVAGTYDQLSGKIRTQSELLIIWAIAEAGGDVTYEIPQGFSTALFIVGGQVWVHEYGIVEQENLVVFSKEGDSVTVTANEDTQLFLLSGKPLDEKVVQHGPFVMNSETEILEAMRDYQMGKMGVLIEDF